MFDLTQIFYRACSDGGCIFRGTLRRGFVANEASIASYWQRRPTMGSKNDRKCATSTQIALQARLMENLGLSSIFVRKEKYTHAHVA